MFEQENECRGKEIKFICLTYDKCCTDNRSQTEHIIFHVLVFFRFGVIYEKHANSHMKQKKKTQQQQQLQKL